jgi:hypothetical protein
LVVLDHIIDDGTEERDRTPKWGYFWILEQRVQAQYYGLYEVDRGLLEFYRLVKGRYEQPRPNRRGHYPIQPLGVELGVWQGRYLDRDGPWLRWYDAQGQFLPTDDERVEHAQGLLREEPRARAQAQHWAKKAERRAKLLEERLRALGVDPDA